MFRFKNGNYFTLTLTDFWIIIKERDITRLLLNMKKNSL